MEIKQKQQFVITHKTTNDVEYTLTAFADTREQAMEMIENDLRELLAEITREIGL